MSEGETTDPALLSKEAIAALVTCEHRRAVALYPRWQHPFTGLHFNRARRSYGQAHRDGRVVLSANFVGTSARDDLLDTVRHEFAHLIVGIHEKHGRRWKTVAASLGAVPRATAKSLGADLHQRMNNAPLTLLAVMRSGEERVMRQAFRRTRRYVDYRFGRLGQRYHINGEFIECFRYVDRREADS